MKDIDFRDTVNRSCSTSNVNKIWPIMYNSTSWLIYQAFTLYTFQIRYDLSGLYTLYFSLVHIKLSISLYVYVVYYSLQ